MKLLLVLTLTIAAIAASPINNFAAIKDVLGLSSRIISGSPAQRGQFKYQAKVSFHVGEQSSLCGGSLINSQWVLTAAHCTDAEGRRVTYTVVLGALYSDDTFENGKNVYTTTRVINHADFDIVSAKNDIALVDLQTKVEFSDVIQPIALSTEDIGADASLTVSGWGLTSDDFEAVPSPFLYYVSITSITNSKCEEYWEDDVIDGTLCCVGSPEHSPCFGDSGGPLVKYNANGQAEQVGIVSYVDPSGCANGNPSAFTRTKYYTQWIANNMK